MSVKYAAVKWNRNKRVYDWILVAGILGYLTAFVAVSKFGPLRADSLSNEIIVLRALGTCAFLLLHIVLCIGPLARFERRFLPILYNRRHLGVATFVVALLHGLFATGYYHGFGRLNPFVSLLATNTDYFSLSGFPFEILGVLALAILALMAVTSHDFWQKNLSPSAWKAIHMLVYPAYGLLCFHVALGALQSEENRIYFWILILGMAVVFGLHLAAGTRERATDAIPAKLASTESPGWIDAGLASAIPDFRAVTICPPRGDRIAVFRHGDRISAVTNVCAHQRGPLGEGMIINGCITCPWHGWEYRPDDGQSPPPFQERIATHDVRIELGRVLVAIQPFKPGTQVSPAIIEEPFDAKQK